MIWWIDLLNWKRWATDFEYRIWSQTRIFDELAQLIMNYIRAKLTCLHILSKYTTLLNLREKMANNWERMMHRFLFFFSLFPMRKILKETNYVTGNALITSHCFLLLFLLRWKKKYKKGCSTIMILLIFRRENSYDWILDDKNNQADDILTYKAVNNN